MSNYVLAQLNIAQLSAPIDSPQLHDFIDNLDRINLLAEQSPGFVWRLQTEDGDATGIDYFGADKIVNMSVWRDVDDPAGPARTILVMVIASHDGGLADSLDDAIPDLLPVDGEESELRRYVAKLIEDLETRFDCVVRFERLPQP